MVMPFNRGFILLNLCLLQFLTASSGAASTSTATAQTTVSATLKIVPTSTYSATPIPTVTHTSQATQTPPPTRTPAPTSTSRPTQTSKPTYELQWLVETVAVSYQVCDGAEKPYAPIDTSPDHQWLAVVCNPAHNNQTYTKVFRLDGSVAWDLSFYEIYGITLKSSDRSDGVTNGAMEVFFWSRDSQYLFLIPVIRYFDDPGLFIFRNILALYRLNLSNGSLSSILKPVIGNIFAVYDAAFSPNGRYLAYISPEESQKVFIVDMLTSVSSFFLIDDQLYGIAGHMSWSPDSNQVILWAMNRNESENVEQFYTLLLIDIQDQSMTRLLDSLDRTDIYHGAWTSSDQYQISDAIFDIQRKEFLPTLTPTP